MGHGFPVLLNLKRRARRIAGWLKQNYRPSLKNLAIAASAIVAVLLIGAALWALLEMPTLQVNELLKPAGDGSAKRVLDKEKAELFQVENEARRTLTQIILGLFGLVALGLLAVRSWANYKDARTAEQGHITDRFNKAIELLGATHEKGEPKPEIRLGAIYALERIARDSARDHWAVMEVLTAYVRENSRWKEPAPRVSRSGLGLLGATFWDAKTATKEEKQSEEKFNPRIDIQAILTVLGRRERSKAREDDNRLDLSNTDLRGAHLVAAHLEGANLRAAHLEEANLVAAHLEGAHLEYAHLEGATGVTRDQINSARGQPTNRTSRWHPAPTPVTRRLHRRASRKAAPRKRRKLIEGERRGLKKKMSIYKQGNKGTYWYEFSFRGKRIRQSTRQRNANLARDMEAAHRTALLKGEVGIKDRSKMPTVAQFVPRFERAIETLCGDKPRTVEFYKSKLRLLLTYEPLNVCRLDGVDEAMVDTYKQHRARQVSRYGRPLSPASVNRELATLRRMLRLAQEWKVIDRVPRIRLLRGERNREFVLSFNDEKLYLEAAPEDLRDVAVLMLDTGLRVGEALSLEWPSARLKPAPGSEYGYVTVRAASAKNAKQRHVPLTARAVAMLKGLGPQKEGVVFHRADGQPLYQTWLNEKHRKLRKTLKLPADFVPHSFRHTYGTRLGEAGADAFTIMRLMGHSTVVVSQKYVHPTPETMESAVRRMAALNPNRSPVVPLNPPPTDSAAKTDKAVTS